MAAPEHSWPADGSEHQWPGLWIRHSQPLVEPIAPQKNLCSRPSSAIGPRLENPKQVTISLAVAHHLQISTGPWVISAIRRPPAPQLVRPGPPPDQRGRRNVISPESRTSSSGMKRVYPPAPPRGRIVTLSTSLACRRLATRAWPTSW